MRCLSGGVRADTGHCARGTRVFFACVCHFAGIQRYADAVCARAGKERRVHDCVVYRGDGNRAVQCSRPDLFSRRTDGTAGIHPAGAEPDAAVSSRGVRLPKLSVAAMHTTGDF